MTCKKGHKGKPKSEEYEYADNDPDIAELLEQEIDAQFDGYPEVAWTRGDDTTEA